jgi:uncharacterized membrane protein
MFSIFFWILAFVWLVGVLVPDPDGPWGPRFRHGRNVLVLAMLVLLGLIVYPFHK